jgi:hypothetical protein
MATQSGTNNLDVEPFGSRRNRLPHIACNSLFCGAAGSACVCAIL